MHWPGFSSAKYNTSGRIGFLYTFSMNVQNQLTGYHAVSKTTTWRTVKAGFLNLTLILHFFPCLVMLSTVLLACWSLVLAPNNGTRSSSFTHLKPDIRNMCCWQNVVATALQSRAIPPYGPPLQDCLSTYLLDFNFQGLGAPGPRDADTRLASFRAFHSLPNNPAYLRHRRLLYYVTKCLDFPPKLLWGEKNPVAVCSRISNTQNLQIVARNGSLFCLSERKKACLT